MTFIRFIFITVLTIDIFCIATPLVFYLLIRIPVELGLMGTLFNTLEGIPLYFYAVWFIFMHEITLFLNLFFSFIILNQFKKLALFSIFFSIISIITLLTYRYRYPDTCMLLYEVLTGMEITCDYF
jgi:hypothetical protein